MDMAMISPQNNKTKAIGIAVGASIIAAVAAMLVPTFVMETLTGATGLSELVPATAAPLGDKARALIAFTAGAVTMVLVLAYLLKRSETKGPANTQAAVKNQTGSAYNQKDGANMIAMLKGRMGNISFPKMPWSRDANSADVLELSDLLKLRKQDTHPDYPARRPISAVSDLGDINLAGQGTAQNTPQGAPLPSVAQPAAEPMLVVTAAQNVQEFVEAERIEMAPEQLAVDVVTFEPVTAPLVTNEQPSLSDLIAQFEKSVEIRKAKLADLEAVASQLATESQLAKAEAMPAPAPFVQAPRPPLEAVPASRTNDDDDEMDAALNAALATLQRMNSK
jgi:membrane protein implicated in regulation of membrane protease activity